MEIMNCSSDTDAEIGALLRRESFRNHPDKTNYEEYGVRFSACGMVFASSRTEQARR